MLLSITTAGYAQFKELHCIKSVDNSRIVFQKVYDYEGDAKAAVSKLLKSGPFTEIDSTGAMLADFRFNPKKYNDGGMMPMYMTEGIWSGNVAVDYKDGKYRVTVTNIQNFTPLEISIGAATATASKRTIESFALKADGTFKKGQENSVVVLSRALSDLFTINETTNDTW